MIGDPVQDVLLRMADKDFKAYKLNLRRLERHSRKMEDVALRQYSHDHPGHPLGRGMPLGDGRLREDGESWNAWWMRVQRQDPCAYCGRSPAGTVDHIVPRSTRRRGLHEWSNFAGACQSCNGSKGSLSLLEFLARRHGVQFARQTFDETVYASGAVA